MGNIQRWHGFWRHRGCQRHGKYGAMTLVAGATGLVGRWEWGFGFIGRNSVQRFRDLKRDALFFCRHRQ
jgi:hypothetical protein